MVARLLYILIFLTPLNSFSQQRLKLNWGFFKYDKPINAKFDAYLQYNIAYRYGIITNDGNQLQIRFEVKAILDTTKSYFNFKMKNDNYKLLNHEQGHADITTIYALKLKDTFSNSKYDKNRYDAQIRQKYADIFKQMEMKQQEYDEETNHGMNNLIQEKWNLYIKKELNLK